MQMENFKVKETFCLNHHDHWSFKPFTTSVEEEDASSRST